MFEKEAIRHAFEATIGVECLVKPVEDFTYEELSDEQQEKAYDFKKGAEFGYHEGFKDCAKSRLNVTTISDCPIKDEWHYVKDKDYPKDNKYVLCILGDISEESYGVGYFSKERLYKPTEWWHFENYDLPDNSEEDWGVSAWKEIVLPELPKENE